MYTTKHPFLLPSLILMSFLWACDEQKPQDLTSLEGSWNLVEYVPSHNNDTEWISYGDSIMYEKHISPDHFVWFKFDKKNNALMGMGGGTYVIENGKYIENINFFYPPGSIELGQSIPFDFKLKGNNWYHKGYVKEFEQSMETAQMIVVDSNKIEEKWTKTTLKPNDSDALVGTWDLISYRDSLEANYTEYPDFIGYIKLLTPTHFTWIYYDLDGDEIYAAGSGPYTYNGTAYKETIDMIHPENQSVIGETVKFTAKIDNSNWKHKGYLPDISVDTNTGNIVKDSALIDERWAMHKEQVYNNVIY